MFMDIFRQNSESASDLLTPCMYYFTDFIWSKVPSSQALINSPLNHLYIWLFQTQLSYLTLITSSMRKYKRLYFIYYIKFTDIYQSEKSKAIIKASGLQGTTAEKIWTFQGSDGPFKIIPRAHWWIIQEGSTTTNALQVALASVKVSVKNKKCRQVQGVDPATSDAKLTALKKKKKHHGGSQTWWWWWCDGLGFKFWKVLQYVWVKNYSAKKERLK